MADSLFQQPSFLRSSVFYEVNIRQYTPEGTFSAFAAHLPRLKDMGVDILWLMPVHPIGKVDRKGSLGSYYSIADHKGINPEFGTAEDLKNLITAIHALGMKVILDWVANHTSKDHVWTSAHPDFYITDKDGNFSPPFDWDDVLQLDHSHTVQQAAMMNAMRYWITDFDVDGFRADMAHLVPIDFWKAARSLLSADKKDLIWLAETENPEYHEAFDISYAWKWMHGSEKLNKREINVEGLVNILQDEENIFPKNALRLFFTSNHDENSWNGTESEKYGALAKAFAVFCFTYPGSALIYSGQELPNLKRLKFFEKDQLEWTENKQLHSLYATLSGLRKRNAALSSPFVKKDFLCAVADAILAYSITASKNSVVVFMNTGDDTTETLFTNENITGAYTDLFTGREIICNGSIFLNLTPGEYLVLEK